MGLKPFFWTRGVNGETDKVPAFLSLFWILLSWREPVPIKIEFVSSFPLFSDSILMVAHGLLSTSLARFSITFRMILSADGFFLFLSFF
jgi:hypothetical protein